MHPPQKRVELIIQVYPSSSRRLAAPNSNWGVRRSGFRGSDKKHKNNEIPKVKIFPQFDEVILLELKTVQISDWYKYQPVNVDFVSAMLERFCLHGIFYFIL